MAQAAALARDDAITEALRAINDAIGDEPPTQQALRIIEAVKRLRVPVRVEGTKRIDYLERVQHAVRAQWNKTHKFENGIVLAVTPTGPYFDAVTSVDTPLGPLRALTYRRQWSTGRIAWMTEYYLNDAPITISEIRAAGLAMRPTVRRQKRKAT